MFRKLILVAIVSALSAVASADFRTISRAYEASLDSFRLPVSTSGTLGFRECETCASVSLSVNNNTRYLINNESVDLKEFRRQLLLIRDRERQAVIVKHDLESGLVSSVSVNH